MKNKSKFRLGFHPFRFLLGYKRLQVPREELERLLNLCIRLQVSYHGISSDEQNAYVCVPFFQASKILRLGRAQSLRVSVNLSGGIPALMVKHRARAGLMLGFALGVLLMAISGTVVWDVRIDGESRLTESEVSDTLRQCGLFIGAKKSSLDIDVIENRVLILSDDISWISINMNGTIANVEIRELDAPPAPEEESATANLVAERGGVITRLEDIRGNIAVSVGEAVSEGQLLVGGIYGDESVGIRYTSAKGRVYAECEQVLSVSVPRNYEKKVYTGRVKCEKYLIFFKNEIKFFSNTGNSYTSCDKIDIVEYLASPSGDDLPVGIRTVKYMEYTLENAERSDDELSSLAQHRMSISLARELSDGDLLRKSSSFELRDDGYTLTCKVLCIRNIAVSKKIEIEP